MRIRRKYECSSCKKIYYKFQGFCTCGKAGTLIEITEEVPQAAKLSATAKRIRVRSKNAERKIAKVMAEADGEDPTFKNVASKNGRVGFINGMRIDAVSKSYVTEAKNRRLPTWFIKAWTLLQQRGRDFNKNILLYIQPPNMPADIPSQGTRIKSEFMHVITESRHENLIREEKALVLILDTYENKGDLAAAINEAYGILGSKSGHL